MQIYKAEIGKESERKAANGALPPDRIFGRFYSWKNLSRKDECGFVYAWEIMSGLRAKRDTEEKYSTVGL